MKIGNELVERENGGTWHNVMPETDVDKRMMSRIFLDAIGGIEEFNDYFVGIGTDGIDDDGSMRIGISAMAPGSFKLHDGLLTLLILDNEYIVRIEFDKDAEQILPESMPSTIICGHSKGFEVGFFSAHTDC